MRPLRSRLLSLGRRERPPCETMGLFSRNKEIVSNEYADLLTKLRAQGEDIALLKVQVSKLDEQIMSMRNRINAYGGKKNASSELEDGGVYLTKDEAAELNKVLQSYGINRQT